MSRKPFYIVVYRGEMEPEEFKGFYAKIDFQYLDSCEVDIFRYKGQVIKYYYTEKAGTYTFYYAHSGMVLVDEGYDSDGDWYHIHEASSGSEGITASTYEYELHRVATSNYAQELVGISHQFNRNYKKYYGENSSTCKCKSRRSRSGFCAWTFKKYYGSDKRD